MLEYSAFAANRLNPTISITVVDSSLPDKQHGACGELEIAPPSPIIPDLVIPVAVGLQRTQVVLAYITLTSNHLLFLTASMSYRNRHRSSLHLSFKA